MARDEKRNKATGEDEWNTQDELCEWLKSKHIYRNEDEERKKLAKLMWDKDLKNVKMIGTNAELLMRVLDVNLGVANKLTNHTQGVSFLYHGPFPAQLLCFPRPLCFPPVPPCAPPVPLVPLCFLLLTWPRVLCSALLYC